MNLAAGLSFTDLESTLDRLLVIAFLATLVFAGFKAFKGDFSRSAKIAAVICLLSFLAYLVKNPAQLGEVFSTVASWFS